MLQKQLRNYEEVGVDWRKIARKVVQAIPRHLKRMEEARRNILQLFEPTYIRAVQRLGCDFNVTLVIYVGIGCGADGQQDAKDSPRSCWVWKTLLGKNGIAVPNLKA